MLDKEQQNHLKKFFLILNQYLKFIMFSKNLLRKNSKKEKKIFDVKPNFLSQFYD